MSLCFFNIVTLVILVHANNKPPYVIRIQAHGEASVLHSGDSGSLPAEQEAVYFTEKFLDKLLGYNHETLTEDLSVALSYMTPGLKKSHIESWKKSGSLEQIKRTKFATKLYFDEILANQDQYGDFIVHFSFASETRPEGGERDLIPFSGHLTLQPTKRDMNNVYGLVVTSIAVNEG